MYPFSKIYSAVMVTVEGKGEDSRKKMILCSFLEARSAGSMNNPGFHQE
jgi:hypothetical protein